MHLDSEYEFLSNV